MTSKKSSSEVSLAQKRTKYKKNLESSPLSESYQTLFNIKTSSKMEFYNSGEVFLYRNDLPKGIGQEKKKFQVCMQEYPRYKFFPFILREEKIKNGYLIFHNLTANNKRIFDHCFDIPKGEWTKEMQGLGRFILSGYVPENKVIPLNFDARKDITRRKYWKHNLDIKLNSDFISLIDQMRTSTSNEDALKIIESASLMKGEKKPKVLLQDGKESAYYTDTGCDYKNTLIYDIQDHTFLISSVNGFKYLKKNKLIKK